MEILTPPVNPSNPIINYDILKIGDSLKGEVIGEIYSSDKDFIIWSPSNNPLGVKVNYSQGEVSHKVNESLMEIDVELNQYYLKKGNYPLSPFTLAHIYHFCIFGKVDQAKKIIKQFDHNNSKYQKEIRKTKVAYLFGGICLVFLNIVFCIILHYTRNQINYEPFFTYFKIATFGSLGGFLSISINATKLTFNSDSSNWINFLAISSRILISMFSSVAIYVFIKANIILGVLNNLSDGSNNYLYYILAFLSGFSESFIPDVLSKLERNTIGKEK